MSYVTITEAARLVKDLKLFYGRKFVEQWEGYSDQELALRFAALLSDVHLIQFEYGLKRMETSAFIPNMPEFKNWCLEKKAPGQNWLTASEAWALCLSYDNKEEVQVSVQSMQAFKKIRHILTVEGQKPAYNAFKGFYERIVSQHKEQGRLQEQYVPLKKLKAPGSDFKAAEPMTDEQRRLLRENLEKINKLKFKNGDIHGT